MNKKPEWTRRLFAAALAGSPAVVAQTPAAPQAAPPAGVAQVPPSPGRRPQQPEPLPFADTLVFTRKDAQLRAIPYPLSQVRLLAGPCLKAADANRAYLMRIAPDRLLHTFRLNAGLSSSAQPLGGWEEPKGELRGHTIGHYLSACALRAASAGDGELKARGDEIVAEIAKCQTGLAGGYLSAYPTEWYNRLEKRQRVWAPFYTYHKIFAGLLDMHVPQVTGAARRFELTCDPRFCSVAEFFWYAVSSARTFATGGSSTAELWRTSPGRLADERRVHQQGAIE